MGDWTGDLLPPGCVRSWGKGGPVSSFLVAAESGGMLREWDVGYLRLHWEAWMPSRLGPLQNRGVLWPSLTPHASHFYPLQAHPAFYSF